MREVKVRTQETVKRVNNRNHRRNKVNNTSEGVMSENENEKIIKPMKKAISKTLSKKTRKKTKMITKKQQPNKKSERHKHYLMGRCKCDDVYRNDHHFICDTMFCNRRYHPKGSKRLINCKFRHPEGCKYFDKINECE